MGFYHYFFVFLGGCLTLFDVEIIGGLLLLLLAQMERGNGKKKIELGLGFVLKTPPKPILLVFFLYRGWLREGW